MQTFVPFVSFEASARALDAKRLGKQRVEVIQIVRALTVPGYAWKSHPAVLMWKGYEEALGRYGLVMCEVWLELGFGDTCAATIRADLATYGVPHLRTEAELADAGALPPWLFDEAVRREPPVGAGPQGPGVLPREVPRRPARPRVRLAGPLARRHRAGGAAAGERAQASGAGRAEDPRRAGRGQAETERRGEEGGQDPGRQRGGEEARGLLSRPVP